MNLRAKRRYEMLARVYAFGAAHAEQFPVGTMGFRLFAIVRTSIDDATRHASVYGSRRHAAGGATTSRRAARLALHKRLEAIRRTARALALDTRGVDKPFRLPRGIGDGRLVRVSRSFARQARKHVRRFIAHGLPSTFLTDLARDIDGFERVLRDRATTRAERIKVGARLKASLDGGFLAVRRLDAVVPNVLDNDPMTLGAWRTARRTRRARPSRRKVESHATTVQTYSQ